MRTEEANYCSQMVCCLVPYGVNRHGLKGVVRGYTVLTFWNAYI